MCALGCWWGEKITVLQVFFLVSKKYIFFMEWRKSAHGLLYFALILLLSEQHHVFKFAVKSCAALVWLAHLHANICDDHFRSPNLLYHDYVLIKLLHKCQSFCHLSDAWNMITEQTSAWIIYSNHKRTEVVDRWGQSGKNKGTREERENATKQTRRLMNERRSRHTSLRKRRR